MDALQEVEPRKIRQLPLAVAARAPGAEHCRVDHPLFQKFVEKSEMAHLVVLYMLDDVSEYLIR